MSFHFYIPSHQMINATRLLQNANAIKDIFSIEYEVAKSSGFHDSPRQIDTSLLLIVTEVAEVVEALRTGEQDIVSGSGKPEGPASELVDIFIRSKDTLLEVCGIEKAYNLYMLKMLYNMTRQLKHGKKF